MEDTRISVISSYCDGKELREEKTKNKYHVRCDGKEDMGNINMVMGDKKIGNLFTISAKAWDRIFGGRDDRN